MFKDTKELSEKADNIVVILLSIASGFAIGIGLITIFS